MSATGAKPIFFQWQKDHGYPVFLRMGKEMMEGRLQKLITDLGFQEIPEADHRKIPANRHGTKILTLSRASTRVAQQIMGSDSLEKYGNEVLSYQGQAHIYLYRRLGMMVFSPGTSMWELGLVGQLETTEDLTGLRVILNRFLSWAVAPMGIIGFWGVATTEGLVAMKQSQSFGEVVMVDVEKRLMFSSAGASKLEAGFTILRADKPGPTGRRLTPEELVSFLSTSNVYLTHGSLPIQLKRAALTLGSAVQGEWSGHSSTADGLSNA